MDKFELQQQGDATLLRKKHPNLYLDLSSIAKGFGVDAVAQVLEDAGIPDYLVEIGGEIRSAGKSPTGEPWRIAIEHPEPPHHPHLIIALPHHGLATSGGYRNFRQDENGNTHTHLINPRTLQPVHNSIASLSVIARTSMEADGLATGLTTLGAADALALARQTHWLWRGKSIWPFASLSGGTARCTRPTQTNSQRLSSRNKHLPHQPCRRAGLFVAPIPHQNK